MLNFIITTVLTLHDAIRDLLTGGCYTRDQGERRDDELIAIVLRGYKA